MAYLSQWQIYIDSALSVM